MSEPAIYNESEHTARIKHKCYECDIDILPGELYLRCTGVWDGEFRTYKLCDCCMNLAYLMRDLGFCWNFGELLDAHADCMEIYVSPKLELNYEI